MPLPRPNVLNFALNYANSAILTLPASRRQRSSRGLSGRQAGSLQKTKNNERTEPPTRHGDPADYERDGARIAPTARTALNTKPPDPGRAAERSGGSDRGISRTQAGAPGGL